MERLSWKMNEMKKQEGEPTKKMWFMSYFWANITYTPAIPLPIALSVKCVHFHCIIATIFWSLWCQHQSSALLSLCALCLSFSNPLAWTFSLSQMFTGRSIVPIPQASGCIYISCEEVHFLPPRTESGQRARLSCSPQSSQQRSCQRCGCRENYILLRNLFMSSSSPRQRANKCCIFRPITIPLLANYAHHG